MVWAYFAKELLAIFLVWVLVICWTKVLSLFDLHLEVKI